MPRVRLPRVRKDGGKVYFRFGKHELEFNSVKEAREFARAALTDEVMQALAVALALARKPNADDDAALGAKSLDVDFSRDDWGRVV